MGQNNGTDNQQGQPNESSSRQWRDLSRLYEALPPHAIEAEMCLLGSMLVEPAVVGDVVLVIRGADDFFKSSNGAIYESMVELYDERSSLDIVQLNQLLADRGVLDTVGGANYLIELASGVPTAANARHYAKLVRDKAMLRELIGAVGEVLHDAYESTAEAKEVVEEAEKRIFHIAQRSDQVHAESLASLIDKAMEIIENNEGRQITGLASGFTELDEMTHGFQRGEMIILAARPSMGKTALALNIAEQVALMGPGVGVFSLEMSKQQLVQRLLSSKSGVNSQKIRRGMLGKDDYRKLHQACDALLAAPILIDDTPGLTLLQMRAKARRMAAKHNIGLVVIDYLQLMTSGRRAESRQVEISEISRGVKAMARELEVPVVCLSQLNRAAEQREGHRPRMSDLRESGSIEQDADVVMMLHREEYYHSDEKWQERMEQHSNRGEHEKDMRGIAELIIAKQRNGPTGTIKLTWDSSTTRFRNYSGATPPGGYYESKPQPREQSAAGMSHFTAGRKTGPVDDFRDGGGPDEGGEDIDHIPI